MNKLITMKDLAKRDAFTSSRDWVKHWSMKLANRGRIGSPWNGSIKGSAVKARIDWGRWLADCPLCGGAEYIDPDDPFIFCLSCGMVDNDGAALPVEMPAEISDIEALVLERPVADQRGGNSVERAFLAKPLIAGLSRSWYPTETVDDLKNQNAIIKKIKKD